MKKRSRAILIAFLVGAFGAGALAQRAFYDSMLLGGCLIRTGTAAPETVLTGNVCDIFLRTTGTAGTTLYIKESGTGTNTGWGAFVSLGTTATPQFAKIGINGAADANAVAKFVGQYYSPLVNDGNSGTTKTIDWNAGNEHIVTLTGNVTFTFSNPVDGGRYVLLLATGAGSFAVTWPATVAWPGGVTPTITTTASKVDLCTFQYVTSTNKYYSACSPNY